MKDRPNVSAGGQANYGKRSTVVSYDMHSEAISWTPAGAVRMLDQTCLPAETRFVDIHTIDDMVEAIQSLRVRGAPLIGVAATMGLAAAAAQAVDDGSLAAGKSAALQWLSDACDTMADARPTAVNLRWAVERVRRVADERISASDDDQAGATLAKTLREEAQRTWDEDARMCQAIAEAGASQFPEGARVLTHCNTGMLATGGIGTALGIIRVAHEQGRVSEVYACEARPLRQGSRLTAWELGRTNIPCTVMVDSAAATVMGQGRVDVVVVGADRIAANGDVANKIGTQNLAVIAKSFGIPFYVAAPRSSFDLGAPDGAAIPIEQRAADEIETADGVSVYNPAFDVTPAALVTGIVTDAGVIEAPYPESIDRLFSGVRDHAGEPAPEQGRHP